jgi:hypothetical protein
MLMGSFSDKVLKVRRSGMLQLNLFPTSFEDNLPSRTSPDQRFIPAIKTVRFSNVNLKLPIYYGTGKDAVRGTSVWVSFPQCIHGDSGQPGCLCSGISCAQGFPSYFFLFSLFFACFSARFSLGFLAGSFLVDLALLLLSLGMVQMG